MYRLISLLLVALALSTLSCTQVKPKIRDELVVERLRMRVTKVRHAIAETRQVIAQSKGAAYLPEIYMRLGELLSEEARYHHMVAYEREKRSTKSIHVPHVRMLKEQAIATYKKIVKDYPKTILADRILFNISHEQRELGLFEDMLKSLEELVKNYPNSNYRAEALLVLGDFYFDKSEFDEAEKRYTQIITGKSTPLLPIAHYKEAWVQVNKGSCKTALTHFEKAIKTNKSSPKITNGRISPSSGKPFRAPNDFELPHAKAQRFEYAGHQHLDVARESLVDLTYCYSRERKPNRAVSYLRKLAANRDNYVAALRKLANRYAMIGEPNGLASVSRELLALAADASDRLDDARMLHTAINRMRDYSRVGKDLDLIILAMRRQLVSPKRSTDSELKLRSEFELLVRDLATKSHRMLQGQLKASKWSKEPAKASQTIKAYKLYLRTFPQAEASLEILQNLAELLMVNNKALLAGDRFREVALLASARIEKLKAPAKPVAEDDEKEKSAEELLKEAAEKIDGKKKPKKKKKKVIPIKVQIKALKKQEQEALYNAVAAYQKVIAKEKEVGFRERTTARAGLRAAGGAYLELGKIPKDKTRKIKFAIAQSYYDAGDYSRAIDLLSAVVYEYPGTREGSASVHIILDSHNTMQDMSGLIATSKRFLNKHSPLSAKLKKGIKPILDQAEQRRIDDLSLAASGDEEAGLEALLVFAEQNKNTSLGEKALLSAFIAARARGDTTQLYALGEQVLKEYASSEQASGIVGTMGRFAAVSYDFERALRYLERAASMDSDKKAGLLLAMGQMREELADFDGALKNYKEALYISRGAARNEAAIRIAILIEKGSTPEKIIRTLQPLAKLSEPEVASRLGLALVRQGQDMEGEELLLQVTQGAATASDAAMARGYYGVAEVMMKLLEEFQAEADLGAIEETLGLIDLVLQAYLAAARQPDIQYSVAAMARLARAAQIGAQKVEDIPFPEGLPPADVGRLRKALSQRSEQLLVDSQAALTSCADRAKSAFLFNEVGRACIAGIIPKSDIIKHQAPKNRRVAAQLPPDAQEAQKRLAKAPDDVESLRILADAFIQKSDYHAARLVLAHAAEVGGDIKDLNDLGFAAYKAGYILQALDAFGRAKTAGYGAAHLNMVSVLRDLGMRKLAAKMTKDGPKEAEGRLLKSAGARP